MEYFNQILFLLGLVAWIAWVFGRRYFNPELDRHVTSAPPTDAQVRWHIYNLRKDVSILAVTNFAILLVLVYALFLRT